jgi:hypothetical protein
VLEDCERPAALSTSSPAIVSWIELFGVREGDALRVTLAAPDGATLAETAAVIEKDRAREFRYVGKKRTAAGWKPGTYRARFTLTRTVDNDPRVLLDIVREVDIR